MGACNDGDAFTFVTFARDDNSVDFWKYPTDYESTRGGGADATVGSYGVVPTGIRQPNVWLDHRRQAPISCEGSPSQSGAGWNYWLGCPRNSFMAGERGDGCEAIPGCRDGSPGPLR
jgi:hypothetical protein